jgi:dynein heavy chain
MKNEWKNISIQLKPHKGYHVIKTWNEMADTLDDHIVTTDMMSFSPFRAHFQEEITLWKNDLKMVLDVTDVWQKV